MLGALPDRPISELVSPTIRARMSQRRVGYERIYELVQRWGERTQEEQAQLPETELLRGYVMPLFEALGWGMRIDERFPDGTPVDLVIHYQELEIPIEVKRAGRALPSDEVVALLQKTQRFKLQYCIRTNFEAIEIWNKAQLLHITRPHYYIVYDSAQDDILAAPVFYSVHLQNALDGPTAPFQPPNSQREDSETNKQPGSEALAAERLDIAVRALADTPSIIDLLNFKDYASALADFIRSEKTTKPLTIGIDAAWGMGKTTLMKMIRDELSRPATRPATWFQRTVSAVRHSNWPWKRNSFPIVWFNAWKYNHEEALWAALVLEILNQVRKQLNWAQAWVFWWRLLKHRFDWTALVRRIVHDIAVVLGVGLLGGLTLLLGAAWLGVQLGEPTWNILARYLSAVGSIGLVTVVFGAGSEVAKKLGSTFDLNLARYFREPEYKARVGFLGEFEDDFKRVVDVASEAGKWPLIVFIDDLDRCAPPRPTDVIEAINTFLDSEHCVFVVGMDSRAVAASIEARYKDLREYLDRSNGNAELTFGQRFLEKIVQINFRLPQADPAVITGFIDATMNATPPTAEVVRQEVERLADKIQAEQRAGKPLPEARAVVQASQPDVSPQIIEQAEREVFARSFDDSAAVRKAVVAAVPHLNYNPRKIKRFINLFRLHALISNRRGLLQNGSIDLELLAKYLIVLIRWPSAVESATADRELLTDVREYARLITQPPTLTEEQRRRLDVLRNDQRLGPFLNAHAIQRYLLTELPWPHETGLTDYLSFLDYDRAGDDDVNANSPRPGIVRLADLIRSFVVEQYIAPARANGQASVTIQAGQVHDAMGLSSRVAAVCGALDADKFQEYAKVRIIRRTGPHQSSTAEWTLALD